MRRALALALALLATPRLARADDVATYEVDGAADAALADARVRALDVAFAAAIKDAVDELVAPADAAAARADVDAQVIARARVYVASFKVTDQATSGDQLHVTVAVRVDRDKLRAKLGELAVPVRAVAPPPGPTAPAPAARRATVLLRVAAPRGVAATYGAAGVAAVTGADEVAAVVRAAGLAQVPAPASGPPAHAEGELPLDDAMARGFAGDAHAEVAVVVGVTIAMPGPVRGTHLSAASARAWARALDGTRVLGEGQGLAGAYGESDVQVQTQAAAAAVAAAARAALPTTSASNGAGPTLAVAAPPPLVAEAGVVLVRVLGAPAWAPVRAVWTQLESTAGVTRVAVRRVSGGEIVLAVTTGQKLDRISAAVRATPALGGKAGTRDGAIVVQLGAPVGAP